MTRPIHLSDPESRQALTGKVMIVRPVRCQPISWHGALIYGSDNFSDETALRQRMVKDAHYQPGDMMLGKEAWGPADYLCDGYEREEPVVIGYRADKVALRHDGQPPPKLDTYAWNWDRVRWHSSTQMPAWAVRHHLIVESVERRSIGSITMDETILAGSKIYVNTDDCPPGKARPLIAITGRYPARKYMPEHKEDCQEADYHRATFASAWMERFGKVAPWPGAWCFFVLCARKEP